MSTTHCKFNTSAMDAAQNSAKRMCASMPAMCMVCMATATSIMLKEIGATTPISLFVLVLIATLLISLCLVLISLTGLGSLVGLITGPAPGMAMGD